ncbi:MAG: GNAT family N-acetyltransferase [Betaproteobacteria bacterium]|nr:GNAT family N-acetyltransferase [Betaproteobacteria bacterium]
MTSLYPSGNALQRASASLRREGVGAFAYKLASEVGFRRALLLERLLDDPIADPAPALPVEFAALCAHEIDDYLVLRPDADPAQVADPRLRMDLPRAEARGTHRVRLLARRPALLVQLPRTHDADRVDGDVYLVDAWTDARYRGQALAHALCLHQLHHFRALGFRRAVRATVPENPSALRVHAKSGFRAVAMVGRIRIGPWRWHFRRDWRGA